MIAVHLRTSEHRAQASGEEAGADPRLRVTVVFTTAEATVSALRTASVFAKSLAARIALVAVEAVPFRLALERPPVPLDFLERKMLSLLSRAAIEAEELSIEICVGRDRTQCLRQILTPRSLVVIGGKNSLWSKERKLESRLTALGHRVVFVDVEARQRNQAWLRVPQTLLRVLLKERELTRERDE